MRSAAIGGGLYSDPVSLRGASSGGKWIGAGDSIGVSQYGQTCHSGSSGALQLAHACRSRVVQTGQTRKRLVDVGAADRAVLLSAAAEALLHRLDLELPLAHVLEVLGRTEEHVDERAR